MLHIKFIIEDGNLILSKCTYHKDMVTNKNHVRGGGMVEIRGGEIIFYGTSFEFGKASMEDIKEAIKNKKVFSNPSCTVHITDKFCDYLYDSDEGFLKLN